MKNTDVIYEALTPDSVTISELEVIRRLGPGGQEVMDSEIYEKCMKAFKAAVTYRYAYAETELELYEQEECRVCALGELRIESRDLSKNLGGCRGAYIMGVTVGLGIDRLLARLRIRSQAEHFITDAIASAAVESLCDKVDDMIRSSRTGCGFKPRFSPGYGDCGIENQKAVLDRINAGATLGITLNDAYFMTPSKSITAIMGIKDEEDNRTY